jgi:hypothetical protein
MIVIRVVWSGDSWICSSICRSWLGVKKRDSQESHKFDCLSRQWSEQTLGPAGSQGRPVRRISPIFDLPLTKWSQEPRRTYHCYVDRDLRSHVELCEFWTDWRWWCALPTHNISAIRIAAFGSSYYCKDTYRGIFRFYEDRQSEDIWQFCFESDRNFVDL